MVPNKIFILDHRSYCLNSLGDSLAQLGHEISYQSSWKPLEVEAGIAHFKPDIVITVGYNRRLFSQVFLDLIPILHKKYNFLHLYWATEDKINFEDWSLTFVQKTKPDIVWTIHPDCIDKYHVLGIPAFYFNFGFNPRIFPEKKDCANERYGITFIGATHLFKKTYRYQSLDQLLFSLVRSKIKTHIWGTGWAKDQSQIENEFGCVVPTSWLHGFLPYKKTSSVYRSSKIVLGVQNADDQVTQRTFEILGTGAFMIASRTKALLNMFEDQKELVLSRSPQETVELVNYYRDRPELRQQIGQNARKKVMNLYTYSPHIKRLWPHLEKLL